MKGPKKSVQLQATNVAELKTALAEVLDLPPYTVQAIAHLAHIERATITLKGWTVKRLGVLVLHQEDEEGNPLPLQAESVAQPQQDATTSAPTEEAQPTPASATPPAAAPLLPQAGTVTLHEGQPVPVANLNRI